MGKVKIPQALQVWIDARKQFRLSHAHVQMARELGMNPKKLGKLDNHHQEPWKLPLPRFIESLYEKRFGRACPEVVMSIEERARHLAQKREARRSSKEQMQRDLGQHTLPEAASGELQASGRPASTAVEPGA